MGRLCGRIVEARGPRAVSGSDSVIQLRCCRPVPTAWVWWRALRPSATTAGPRPRFLALQHPSPWLQRIAPLQQITETRPTPYPHGPYALQPIPSAGHAALQWIRRGAEVLAAQARCHNSTCDLVSHPNAKAKVTGAPARILKLGKPGWRPRSASDVGYASSASLSGTRETRPSSSTDRHPQGVPGPRIRNGTSELPFGHPMSGGSSFSSAGTKVRQNRMSNSVFVSRHAATPILIQAGTLPSTHNSTAARDAVNRERSAGSRNRPPRNLIVPGGPRRPCGSSYRLMVKHKSMGSCSRT
jgi:hypothetical protein